MRGEDIDDSRNYRGKTTLLRAQDEMHNSFPKTVSDIKEMFTSTLKMQQTVGGGI